jgi:hypothetical protein
VEDEGKEDRGGEEEEHFELASLGCSRPGKV